MSEKIFVISNEQIVTEIVVDTLKNVLKNEYTIETTDNVKSALSFAAKNNYSLIIINHSLNTINALELTKKLFENEKILDNNTPIVIIAHLERDSEILSSAFDAGVIDYLQKPINTCELILRIKHILRLRKKLISFKQSLIISGSLIDNLERLILDIEKLKKQLETENDILSKRMNTTSTEYASYLHDLKTPFSSLLGNCQLLLKGYLGEITEDQKTSIQSIERAGKKLLALIDDYLDNTRMQAGRMQLFLNRVDVPFLLELSLRDMLLPLKEKGLVIETICESDVKTVEVDIDKIIRVLQNLLSNAIKNTPASGKITFAAKNYNENEVLIYVRDTGQGISKENLTKIFEVFEQGGKNISGSGLGLAICKEIVENLHRSKIWVESKAGEGSTFYFTLPVDFQVSDAEFID